MATQRHNVFTSYHHANDQAYRNKFEQLFNEKHDILISKSVQIGDIDTNTPTERIRQIIRDNYLRDTTVTVVLIGSQTWQRKHVDWEIGSSLRHTQYNSRSGLIGIFLPTYTDTVEWDYVTKKWRYNPYTVPPRLHDNVVKGFASLHKWDTNPNTVQDWIHKAFERRFEVLPDNSMESFTNNRSGLRWY